MARKKRLLSVEAAMRARVAPALQPLRVISMRLDAPEEEPTALQKVRLLLGDKSFVAQARAFISAHGHGCDSGALRELEAEVAAALGEKAPTQTPKDPRIPKDIRKDLR